MISFTCPRCGNKVFEHTSGQHDSQCVQLKWDPPTKTVEAGKKFDTDKNRLDLLPPDALLCIGDALTYGAKKYGDNNWRYVEGLRWRYFGAMLRHLFAWWRGEHWDKESKLHHLAHAGCCLMFLLQNDMEQITAVEIPPKAP